MNSMNLLSAESFFTSIILIGYKLEPDNDKPTTALSYSHGHPMTDNVDR
jgi:hypothetical protein